MSGYVLAFVVAWSCHTSDLSKGAGGVLGAAGSLPYGGQPVVSAGLGPQGKNGGYGGATYGGIPTLGPDAGLGTCIAHICYSNATCKSRLSWCFAWGFDLNVKVPCEKKKEEDLNNIIKYMNKPNMIIKIR